MRRLLFPIATVSLAVVAACSSDSPEPGHAVIAVKVSPDNPIVMEGAPIAFRATVITETGESKDVSDSPSTTWLSSDPGVVEVNADGAGEATGPGSAFVTARNSGITSPAQNVTVNPIPTTPPPTPTPTPAPTATYVVISEVMFDSNVEPGGEYVELFNPTANPIDISLWTLSTDGGTGTGTFTFPAATSLANGAYVVVANNVTTYNTEYGQTTIHDGAFTLTNGGDWVVLKDASAVTVDEMAYIAGSATGPGGPKPASWCATNAPTATNGTSVSRNPDGSDGDNCNDWVNSTVASPGVANP